VGGIAYRHVGISDIPRTSTSPDPEPGDIDVSEDVASVALARDFSTSGAMGLAVRYARSTGGPDDLVQLSVDYGVLFRTELPLRPRIGGVVRGIGLGTRFLAGIGMTPPASLSGPLLWDLSYGLDVDGDRNVTQHRLSLRGSWRARYHLAAGANRNGVDGWTALWMVGVDFGRYSLAVMREGLANGFGAAHYYRLAIHLP
jgi:hypothetical protein